MDIKKLNEEVSKLLENENDKNILDVFKLVTEDSNKWAYGWCDMEILTNYINDACKTCNVTEEQVTNVLKNNTDKIKQITQESVNDFIQKEHITDEDIIDELNGAVGSYIYIGWGNINNALKDIAEGC